MVTSHRRPLFAFLLLSLVWGSSYLFIKIAIQDLGPMTLVGLRLVLGLFLLGPLLVWRRLRLPRDGRTWLDLAVAALVGTALPFTLISWGEQTIDSGLAALLTSTTPFFAFLLADVWQRDRPVSPGAVAGLVVGFGGILILVGGQVLNGGVLSGSAGQLAVIAASGCYAISSTFIRKRLGHLHPFTISFGQVLLASFFAWAGALVLERPTMAGGWSLGGLRSAPVLLSVIWLGVAGSGLAYILYNYVLQSWGATRTTMVTYLIPVVGLVLGVLILDETLGWRLVVGGILIIGGMIVVNRQPRAKP